MLSAEEIYLSSHNEFKEPHFYKRFLFQFCISMISAAGVLGGPAAHVSRPFGRERRACRITAVQNKVRIVKRSLPSRVSG
jgi:hypothetical protein